MAFGRWEFPALERDGLPPGVPTWALDSFPAAAVVLEAVSTPRRAAAPAEAVGGSAVLVVPAHTAASFCVLRACRPPLLRERAASFHSGERRWDSRAAAARQNAILVAAELSGLEVGQAQSEAPSAVAEAALQQSVVQPVSEALLLLRSVWVSSWVPQQL